jgi:hypothetical protein
LILLQKILAQTETTKAREKWGKSPNRIEALSTLAMEAKLRKSNQNTE